MFGSVLLVLCGSDGGGWGYQVSEEARGRPGQSDEGCTESYRQEEVKKLRVNDGSDCVVTDWPDEFH